ncbi:FkbM family methyltransferase [Parablautia intestinalis]|uniref:FkbM family methyltransferase n=1 Tax=Parablautia intestinalis TaxID=2320100 RepID=UPI00256EE9F8|nr:FkbM family methyltransferase [Parablautia intestinalis]
MKIRIEELRKSYINGDIDVKSYAQRLFENYEELLSYRELIKTSLVHSIVINEKEVLFKMCCASPLSEEKYEIVMVLYRKDSGAVNNTILSLGDYEPLELDMVSRIVSYMKEGVFFDVGANLGWYTMNVKKQNPQMKIYAFEPVTETFNKLNRNVELNKLEKVDMYNIGLYKEDTTLKFYYDIVASGASSMQNLRENSETREITCKMERLDDFVNCHDIRTIDFVKCDVEGSELFVYEGGIESIKKYKPVIFSEMLRKWSAKFGYHPNNIIDLLATAGYQCFVIKEKGKLRKFHRVDEETIETNYFFLHPEKHAEIMQDLVESVDC